MKSSNPVVRLHLVLDQVHGGLHIRQWDRLADLRPGVHELYSGPVELRGITETLAEGLGFWSSCSGCYETEDGQPVGRYSYSAVMKCALGSGCSECGGLGAVWDSTDWDEVARIDGLNEPVGDDEKCSACPCGRSDPHANTLACIKAAGDQARSRGSIRGMLQALDEPGGVFDKAPRGIGGEAG